MDENPWDTLARAIEDQRSWRSKVTEGMERFPPEELLVKELLWRNFFFEYLKPQWDSNRHGVKICWESEDRLQREDNPSILSSAQIDQSHFDAFLTQPLVIVGQSNSNEGIERHKDYFYCLVTAMEVSVCAFGHVDNDLKQFHQIKETIFSGINSVLTICFNAGLKKLSAFLVFKETREFKTGKQTNEVCDWIKYLLISTISFSEFSTPWGILDRTGSLYPFLVLICSISHQMVDLACCQTWILPIRLYDCVYQLSDIGTCIFEQFSKLIGQLKPCDVKELHCWKEYGMTSHVMLITSQIDYIMSDGSFSVGLTFHFKMSTSNLQKNLLKRAHRDESNFTTQGPEALLPDPSQEPTVCFKE